MSEHKLIEKIKEMYGKKINGKYSWDNIIIGIGDWCESNHMKNFVPTKGIGLRRLLEKFFQVFLVDEHNTSKTCNKCKSETEYYKKVVDQPTFRLNKSHVHGLLCCVNKNCSTLWNRDTNGAKNILEILNSHINGHGRPEPFKMKLPLIHKSNRKCAKRDNTLLQKSNKPSEMNSKKILKKLNLIVENIQTNICSIEKDLKSFKNISLKNSVIMSQSNFQLL